MGGHQDTGFRATSEAPPFPVPALHSLAGPTLLPTAFHLFPTLGSVLDGVLSSGVLAADEAQQGSPLGMLMPILIVGFIFYFLVFRPASKERKAREAQVQALKKHDKVITNAGIHGVVTALDDDSVTLRIDDKNNVRVRFLRSAVWQVQGADATPAKS